jgi:hypothetical protein
MLSWFSEEIASGARLACRAALSDVGEHEEPFGSNRGVWIDTIVRAAGSPPGSPWCGCAIRWWWRAGSLLVPEGAGEADAWRRWGMAHGTWGFTPAPGSIICYSSDGLVVHHVGLVVCAAPLLTIEGNTSLDGYSNDGEIVTLKYDAPHATKILGYVAPVTAPAQA